MKKLVYTLSVIAALLSSCVKSADEQTIVEKSTTISVEVTPEQSRTYVDNDNIFWSPTGEQVDIIYFNDISTSSSRRQTASHQNYTLTDNRIEFTADITATDGATTYTFGAFYPYVYKYSTSSINLTVPQEQTPTLTSYDPKADIMVSENPVVTQGVPSKISFTFARMVALAKMTLVGIGKGEKIEKVVFSSPAKPAGAVDFKVHEQGTVEKAKWYNNYEDITLNLENRVATGEDTVWFVTIPTDLSGTSFTVTVITDKFNYTKTVDLAGKTLNFERANIAQFRVKELVKAEKPKAYKLLTNIKELTAGDEFVLCNKSSASSVAKLLSATPNGSSYLSYSSSFTINSDNTITELPADGVVFTIENGAIDGTFAFNSANGYLCNNYDAVNYTNVLTFSNTKNEYSSWSVNLGDYNVIKIFNEATSRYVNNYTSSSRFQLSYSASSIYMWYVNGQAAEEPEQPVVTPLATPVVTATAAANTVTVEWAAVEGAKDYTVTCGTATQTVTASPVTFADLEYATEYNVTVVANPANEAVNSASEAGKATVTTEAEQSGSEAQSVKITFPIASTKSGNTVGTIYVGDVIISSTGSWRDNRTNGRDCIFIGRTTSNELRIEAQNGKTITKVTLTAPVDYLVDLKWKEYDGYSSGKYADSWTGECKSRIVFTPNGSSHSDIESIVVEYK
ncbi:MAG: hypothetical protein IIV72_03520 [Alistipes sp.]|nr:hypothetical protein [Alistipes sp.]